MELKATGICKAYRKHLALRDVGFTLTPGIYGLLGENGAGKSTLMRILTTVDTPTAGQVTCNGQNIYQMEEAYRGLVGYLPQEFDVYPGFTARDFLNYMGALKGINGKMLQSKAGEMLSFVNLDAVADKKVRTFSGGMKRRLGIAQALMADPSILILDEPTAGLDPAERNRFANLIRGMNKDRIVLLSTHIVSDIEAIATNLILLKQGRVVQTGQIGALVQQISGLVWETVVSAEQFEQLRKERMILSRRPLGDHIRVRYAGERFDDGQSTAADPVLEDYYMFRGGNSDQEGI